MMELKNLSSNLYSEIELYLSKKSISRKIFNFIQDEIPNDVKPFEFYKKISLLDVENNYNSILHSLCIELKYFEDMALILSLDKASNQDNKSNYTDQVFNIKNALCEAKILIDRWDRVTNIFLLNKELFNACNAASEDKQAFDKDNETGRIWGADIIFDQNIPENNIYALCHFKSNRKDLFKCGNVICENFGIDLCDNNKSIEIFSKIYVNITDFRLVSKIPIKTYQQ